jgi:hypothetical protein
MVTSHRVQQATSSLPLGNNIVQTAEAPTSLSRVDRDARSIRPASQGLPSQYPRIPRFVSKHERGPRSPLDSQFQVNASQVQKPLSLIVPVSLFSP